MSGTRAVLEGGSRCFLARPGRSGPLLEALTYWYDGESLWGLVPPGTSGDADVDSTTGCAVQVRGHGGAVLARGQARVLSLRDPAGLLLRVPALTAVLAALALREPSSLLSSVRSALLEGQRPSLDLAVIHVRLTGAEAVMPSEPPPGIAPPLPPAVPAEVRRALAGARRVLVARGGGTSTSVELVPAWWDQRFTLLHATGRPLGGNEPVAVAVDAEPVPQGHGAVLVLHGRTREGMVEVTRATYALGGVTGSVVVVPARSGLVLPD